MILLDTFLIAMLNKTLSVIEGRRVLERRGSVQEDGLNTIQTL